MTLKSRILAAFLVVVGLVTQVGNPATADNSAALGMSVFRDLLVDQVHGRVFVSGGSLTVADLDGQVIGKVPGISAARQMTMSPDGSKLVVANGDFLTIVDPVSMTVTDTIATGVGSCPNAVASASGKVFFTYGDCGVAPGLGAVDLATDVITTGLSTGGPVSSLAQLESVPSAPSLIAARFPGANSWDNKTLVLLNTSGGPTPSTGLRASKSFAAATGLDDIALTPDGTQVIVASGEAASSVYSTGDLSLLGSYAGPGTQRAVAARVDGAVGTAVNSSQATDLRFFAAGQSAPMRQVDLGTTSNGNDVQVQPQGLAFGTKRAYAVTSAGTLRTFTAGPAPSLTIKTDKSLYAYGGSATVAATLGTTVDRTISLYRTPVGGTRTLVKSGTVDPVTGKLSARLTNLTQNVTFEAVFGGDDDFAPKTVKVAVKVGAKVTLSSASTSMSSYFHKLRHSPAPVISVAALPVQPTTVCVKFVAQIYRSGAWRSFGGFSCPKRSTSSGRYGITLYDFPVGTRMRFQASYPTTTKNQLTVSKWYYVLFT